MTVSRNSMMACAKNIVKTSNLSSGDAVVIRGGAHTLQLLERIALEVYKVGAIPMITVTSDKYTKEVYDKIPASTLAVIPKHFVGAVKECDMIIGVEELDDPSIAARFPREKLHARQKSMMPIRDLMSHPTKAKKWLYAGWPTRAAARSYGISYGELEEAIIRGMTVPPETLMRIGKQMEKKFKDAARVHVWDNKGTDFRLDIKGKMHIIDDGVISKEDYDAGDRGANLPAGELFFAPRETVGEGTFFCPVTRDSYSQKIITDVHLEFRQGRLLLDRVTASRNVDALISSFNGCEALDKTKYAPVRTTNIAELGIGFNPRIKRAFGYILTDEKVKGTVHIAFGGNKGFGGRSQSTMHWDFVSAPGANIEVEKTDGKTVQVMRGGKLL